MGGMVEEVVSDEGLQIESDCPFKGDIDLKKLDDAVARIGGDNISFIRIEVGTNLIGGQPISLQNMRTVASFCREKNLIAVLDASLLADNLYFIKTREPECMNRPLSDIVREIGTFFDIIYFSARKLGSARGGGICTSDRKLFERMRTEVTLFEGFLTYGGMSVREMEAMAVGIQETLDLDVISQTPIFVEALVLELLNRGIPVVTPAGGLGCHVDAKRFLSHVPQTEYPAGALAAALYIVSGVRGMERGTISEEREADGSEHLANMELVRLALPKRVFTLSQVKFVADRIGWLFKNRDLVGGLEFVEEPEVLRFFFGRLKPKGNWQQRLTEQFIADMPSGL